jgi:DNA-binding transcriptional ArsR family regulator
MQFLMGVRAGALTYSYIGIYILAMARAATTSDVFNAVAEPRRREVIELLAGGERSVGELVAELGSSQPQVSKHLRVLLEVELVSVRREGRHRLYRLEAEGLKQIHEWAQRFEPLWQERFDLLEEVVQELKKEEEGVSSDEQ